MHKPLLTRVFVLWLPIAVATSSVFIFAYWGVQQEYRLSFNDQQIQLAEDGALRLAQGETPTSIIQGAANVDISASLAPWITVYDSSGTPLASTGLLNGAPLHLPQGVFDASTWRRPAALGVPIALPANETFFTWQPEPAVRQAVVLVAVGNGEFVASGRNMREVEAQESTLTQGAALAWGGTELGTLIVIIALLAIE